MTNVLNTCHVNAQSLNAHFDEFQQYFLDNFYHIIAVSETWLKPSFPSSQVSLTGYTFLRHDRADRTGGGVGMYIHDSLRAKVLLLSPHLDSPHLEYMFTEISSISSPLLYAVVYRPPRVPFDNLFESSLVQLVSSYTNVIIAGDFNINMISDSSDKSFLTELVFSLNLYLVPYFPTHHTQFSDTWLDLHITDSPLSTFFFLAPRSFSFIPRPHPDIV